MTNVVIILIAVCAIALVAEACLIMPDKMPWNWKKVRRWLRRRR